MTITDSEQSTAQPLDNLAKPASPPGRPVRVGFVGTGYIADWHAKALDGLQDIELSASCDRATGRATRFAEAWGIAQSCGDTTDLTTKADIDAAHVLVTPNAHEAVTRPLLDAGIAVLLEKPMAASPEACQQLTDLAAERGTVLAVSHNFLFARPYVELRNAVQSGRLGPIDQVTVNWYRPLPFLKEGPFQSWMLRDPRNIMLEIGSHAVAFMLDLVGEPDDYRVNVSNPIDLPTGIRFYRRWQIRAWCGRTAIDLNLSFAEGFDEFVVHARGGFGSSTANIGDDTCVTQKPTGLAPDFDRFKRIREVKRTLGRQAWRTIFDYVTDTLKLRKAGNPFVQSIRESQRAFYHAVFAGSADELDQRLQPSFGTKVIEWAARISDEAGLIEPSSIHPGVEPQEPSEKPVNRVADILVIGGTGFIGRALVAQLTAQGYCVRVLTRSGGNALQWLDDERVEVVEGDTRNREDLDRALDNIRFVYHLAKGEPSSLQEAIESDVEPLKALTELCQQHGIERFVYTGTIDSFYLGPKAGTITQQTPLDPHIHRRNPYAHSKALAEQWLNQIHHEQGFPVVIMRPGVVIGDGGPIEHMGVALWDGPGVCRYWGNGRNPLPLVLVEDVAKALRSAIESPHVVGKHYNLCTNSGLTARNYVEAIEQYAGVKIDQDELAPRQLWLVDSLKWLAKLWSGHPDRHRRPSLRDWQSRRQMASFTNDAAKRDLGWEPTEDPQQLVTAGIHRPVDQWLR